MYLLDLGSKRVLIPGTVTEEEWASRLAASKERYKAVTGAKKFPEPKVRKKADR